jgi:hypothetical protein
MQLLKPKNAAAHDSPAAVLLERMRLVSVPCIAFAAFLGAPAALQAQQLKAADGDSLLLAVSVSAFTGSMRLNSAKQARTTRANSTCAA